MFREGWGCEKETPNKVQVSIRCPSCDGESRKDGIQCDQCGGAGEVEFFRCPNAIIRESGGRASELLNYYTTIYKAGGGFPSPGGWFDQSAFFCRGVRFLDRIYPRLERQARVKAGEK